MKPRGSSPNIMSDRPAFSTISGFNVIKNCAKDGSVAFSESHYKITHIWSVTMNYLKQTVETPNKGRLHFSRKGSNKGLFDEKLVQNVTFGVLFYLK